jgi:acyl carrier protein phosphodiesterase
MNYLAHIFLSCNNEDILIGNFIADSISINEVALLPEEVQAGVMLHRKIDSYTDTHSIVRQATQRLQPHHHKYSPVVIDVLYDHLLANNWHHYSGSTLPVFAQNVYKVFSRRMEDMPVRLKRKLPVMIEKDWLNNYKSIDGLKFVLDKMDERTRFPSNFGGAVEHLLEEYELFTEEFNTFFPEIIAYVDNHCNC